MNLDPLSESAAIIRIVILSRQISDWLCRISPDDAKIRRLYAQFTSLQKDTEAWGNQMRDLSREDIRARISAKCDTFVLLLHKLSGSYEDAQSRYNIWVHSHGSMLNRMKGTSGPFESMRKIIDILVEINDALKRITSRPPEYSPGRYLGPQEFQRSTGYSSQPFFDVPSGGTLSGSLRTIHNTCSSILYTIERHIRYPSDEIAPRLKRWGVGFFHGSFSIDAIMVGDENRYGVLRKFLLRIFVSIAVTEGRFLRSTPKLGRQR